MRKLTIVVLVTGAVILTSCGKTEPAPASQPLPTSPPSSTAVVESASPAPKDGGPYPNDLGLKTIVARGLSDTAQKGYKV